MSQQPEHPDQAATEDQSAGAADAVREAGDSGRSARPVGSWIYAKRPVVAFVVLFVVLMGSFYAVTLLKPVQTTVMPAYLRLNARASAVILNLFGENAKTRDTSVTSPRYSVNIQHGCDAIQPSGLFLAAVLAFPATFRSKLPGLVVGTLVLALINLVRIVTLFYTGIYRPRWFEIMHIDVWQPIFILLSLVLWILWAWWATRDPKQTIAAAAHAN
ncbi:MAG: exosortase H [Phycisphaerae bacterium]